jgi:ABC-type Fe3+/spermidine/putrescine transport system ATPase subunit
LPTPGSAPSCATDEAVRLNEVAFAYGTAAVLRGVSLAVPAGRFLTLLGPSGCGKTTLLKLIGGYLTASSGQVVLRGRDVTALPAEARNVGMVFQNYALFPHLDARRNVAFPLEVRGTPRGERQRRVEAMLDLVGLSAQERGRRPAALSGGQQQRVALARALVFRPDVLLLDEPLANLDRHLREQLRSELRRLHAETGVAAVMVTHDQEEALAVSDLLGVMNDGRLLQVGTPAEIYDRPRTPFVARFLGDANLLPGSLFGRAGLVMVRPERCVFADGAWSAEGRVVSVTFLGADVVAEVECAGGVKLHVRSRQRELRTGEVVRVGVPAEAVWQMPDADEGSSDCEASL